MRTSGKVVVRTAAVLLAFLILVQLAGSHLATHLANRRLAAMPQFSGRVESVSLQLWRGAIAVTNLEVRDRSRPGGDPAVKVPHGLLSLRWAPLLRGHLGGDLRAEGAQIVMIRHAAEDKTASEEIPMSLEPVGRAWQEVLAKEFPLEILHIELKSSQVRFDDRRDRQAESLLIDEIDLALEGFDSQGRKGDELPATAKMTARLAESGTLTVDARINPSAPQPRFEVEMEVKSLSLPAMHEFLVKHALIDVQSGEFELYAEVSAAEGHYNGYIKPFFKDLRFEAVPDPEENALQRIATNVAETIQGALKNDRGDVATKVPFHGNFERNEVDVWTAVENLLRNAFIQGLREGLEGERTAKASAG